MSMALKAHEQLVSNVEPRSHLRVRSIGRPARVLSAFAALSTCLFLVSACSDRHHFPQCSDETAAAARNSLLSSTEFYADLVDDYVNVERFGDPSSDSFWRFDDNSCLSVSLTADAPSTRSAPYRRDALIVTIAFYASSEDLAEGMRHNPYRQDVGEASRKNNDGSGSWNPSANRVQATAEGDVWCVDAGRSDCGHWRGWSVLGRCHSMLFVNFLSPVTEEQVLDRFSAMEAASETALALLDDQFADMVCGT